MKQLKIIKLIYLLIKMLFIHGNLPVFYHCIGGAKDVPIEIEEVEVRNTLLGKKITMY